VATATGDEGALSGGVGAGCDGDDGGDGLPHRMLRTPFVDSLERAGQVRALLRAAYGASAFRRLSGLTWPRMIRDGLALKHGKDLGWGQVLLAASTPMLLRAAMVEGRTDLGVMASGQVAG
jgi:hypothetical protein